MFLFSGKCIGIFKLGIPPCGSLRLVLKKINGGPKLLIVEPSWLSCGTRMQWKRASVSAWRTMLWSDNVRRWLLLKIRGLEPEICWRKKRRPFQRRYWPQLSEAERKRRRWFFLLDHELFHKFPWETELLHIWRLFFSCLRLAGICNTNVDPLFLMDFAHYAVSFF